MTRADVTSTRDASMRSMVMALAARLSDPGLAPPAITATAMQTKMNIGALVIAGIQETASCRKADPCSFIDMPSEV